MTHFEQIEPASDEPFLDRIKPYLMEFTHAKKCEVPLQFGAFFDGTGNNLRIDSEKLSHSNIARLLTCYPHVPVQGIGRLYIPGVGTDFEEIGTPAEGWKGTAFGIGCEARVLFGLLKTFDFIHQIATNGEQRYTKDQLRVLCKHDNPGSKRDLALILSLGTATGLQECGDNGAFRRKFLSSESKFLKGLLRKSSVRVSEVVIDIFGFSRGAASARAYASWLTEILDNGRLAGIPLTIRFMGLFDTVASAGIPEMLLDGIANRTGGHGGWARPESLRIPSRVANCVHLVAMHELRKNFPIDAISVEGERAPNFHEFAYPGSHSDVGGGYAPGELGIASASITTSGDALKLSQIPLNDLFKYAVAGFVPLDNALARRSSGTYDPFAVSPQLRQAFSSFVRESGSSARQLKDWMEAYLAWRWHVRKTFASTEQVKNAKGDRELLLEGNRKLISDADFLLHTAPTPEMTTVIKDFIFNAHKSIIEGAPSAMRRSLLDPEALEVLRRVMQMKRPSKALTHFFEHYVHDSYAGFIANLKEPSGYWRYRKGFRGSDKPLNAGLNAENIEVDRLS